MAMTPAVAGSASAAPPNTTANTQPQGDQGGGGGGGDIQALAGQIRQVAQQLDQLAQNEPTAAPIVQQIKQLLRQVIVQKAATAQQNNPSAQALPMGGQ